MIKMLSFWLLGVLTTTGAFSALHPLSDEFIDHINSLQTTWKAGRNFPKDTPLGSIERLLGVLINENRNTLETVQHFIADEDDFPENFDARKKWPGCESIRTIRDQSNCGSCWAVAAAAAMSDRICIASNGTDQTLVSDMDLISGCVECRSGCDGGYPEMAWIYWRDTGIVSVSPSVGMQNQPPTPSRVSCDLLQSKNQLRYDTPQSKTFASYVHHIYPTAKQIQAEIMRRGPVEATFDVYDDFLVYKSGVYQATTSVYLGGHAVRIIGWGVENEVPYWLITNSWNESWGDSGLFKIRRGINECGIESEVVTGWPKL